MTPAATVNDRHNFRSRWTLERVAWLYGPFALMVALSFCSTGDDPLITLRYVSNVLRGHGPVFNIGERVEGFSSPLHLVILVLFGWLPGGATLLRAKLLSLVFGVLAVWQGGRLIDRVDLPGWATRLALLLTGGSWILAFASSNGLETSLECWLLTLLLVRVTARDPDQNWPVTAVVGALLALTRPEGLGLVAAIAFASLVDAGWGWARLRWTAGPVSAIAAMAAFRLVYYRSVLPNTFYAKQLPVSRALPSGVGYVLRSLLPAFGPVDGVTAAASDLLTVVLLGAIALGFSRSLRTRSIPSVILAAVGAQVAFAVLAGGDWMPGGRFVAPIVPGLVILEVTGLVELAELAPRPMRRNVERSLVVTLLLTALLPVRSVRAPMWASGGSFDPASLIRASHFPFGPAWLAGAPLLACAAPGDLVAYSEMGYAGFVRPDVRFLDTRGLISADVARRTPRRIKHTVGVEDDGWRSPTSPVGSIIVRRQPAIVLSLDGVAEPGEQTVLAGRYVVVRTVVTRGVLHVPISLYRRVDRQCPGLEAGHAP